MMNKSKILFKTAPILLSITIISSPFGMDYNDNRLYATFSLGNQAPLTVRFSTKDDISIPFLRGRTTMWDIKTKAAEEWNKNHDTKLTAEDFSLAGPGNLIGSTPAIKNYEDTDVISKEGLMKDEKRLIIATIKQKEENNHATKK